MSVLGECVCVCVPKMQDQKCILYFSWTFFLLLSRNMIENNLPKGRVYGRMFLLHPIQRRSVTKNWITKVIFRFPCIWTLKRGRRRVGENVIEEIRFKTWYARSKHESWWWKFMQPDSLQLLLLLLNSHSIIHSVLFCCCCCSNWYVSISFAAILENEKAVYSRNRAPACSPFKIRIRKVFFSTSGGFIHSTLICTYMSKAKNLSVNAQYVLGANLIPAMLHNCMRRKSNRDSERCIFYLSLKCLIISPVAIFLFSKKKNCMEENCRMRREIHILCNAPCILHISSLHSSNRI